MCSSEGALLWVSAFEKSKKQHSSLEESTEKWCSKDGRRGEGRTGEAPRGCGAYITWVPMSQLLVMDISFAGSVALGRYLISLSPRFLNHPSGQNNNTPLSGGWERQPCSLSIIQGQGLHFHIPGV